MGILLSRENITNVQIGSPIEVVSFTYTGNDPTSILIRLVVTPVAGNMNGGYYYPGIFINDIQSYPVFPISVDSTANGFVVESQSTMVDKNDVISAVLVGPVNEFVNVNVILYDITSLSNYDITRITDAMSGSLSNTTIRPERTVLGSCKTPVKSFKLPSSEEVKSYLLPIKRV